MARGGRAGPARIEEAEKKKAELEERRKNNGVKDDFYRFQNREKRKEAEINLRKRFEEDRRRVARMRERRGRCVLRRRFTFAGVWACCRRARVFVLELYHQRRILL